MDRRQNTGNLEGDASQGMELLMGSCYPLDERRGGSNKQCRAVAFTSLSITFTLPNTATMKTFQIATLFSLIASAMAFAPSNEGELICGIELDEKDS